MRIEDFVLANNVQIDAVLTKDDKSGFDWAVTVKCGGQTFSTTYHCGRAWQERYCGYDRCWKPANYEYIINAEKAKKNGGPFFYLRPALPDVINVLHSLHLDALSIEDNPLWEDWASSFGYDVDSIKDRKVYKACRKAYLSLKKFFGKKWNKFLACESK